MIKGIQKIKGVGVYADYARPAGTEDFSGKNLIYGWNYSGKTTISRLFGLLETKQSNPDLAGCSFTFNTDQGQVTEANYVQSNLIVRVFNSDFIAKNLNFAGLAFAPILLLGTESEEAQKKLDGYEIMADKARQRFSGLDGRVRGLETKMSTAKTQAAARIKRELGIVAAYTSTHLDKDITTVQLLDESQSLSGESFKSDLKLALTSDQDKPSRVDEIMAAFSLSGLFDEAKEIMVKTPNLTSTIEHLVKNPLIERWVETGLPHHVNKESCEFCGGEITAYRLAELQGHFSKDLAEHKQKINQLLARVELSKAVVSLPTDAELNAPFRERYAAVKSEVIAPVQIFNKAVDDLAEDLRRKLNAPFEVLSPRPLSDLLIEPVEVAIEAVNAVIRENNSAADNFSSARVKAVERLKRHYVQEFLSSPDRGQNDKELTRLKRYKDRLSRFSVLVQDEIVKLKAIISHAQRGREEINQRLESLLGSQSVQIRVVQAGDLERFQLVRRDGSVAKHLSEGEKTAVAFAFFLTKLKELKADQFKQAVVYIDDPISSLDSNHIFQVTAMIKEFFFHQEVQGGPWSPRCAQTFFSTHNFEFFSLLRELNPSKADQAKNFLVRRVAPDKSSLGNMPNSMFRYSSEYHFLFDVLHKFKLAPDKTEFDVLMLLPNAVRRFVELYTFSRYPGARSLTVDQRADRIFGPEKSKRILKVLHYFSHANNIERLAENNELIFDIEAAVNELIDMIKVLDPMHMEALELAVS